MLGFLATFGLCIQADTCPTEVHSAELIYSTNQIASISLLGVRADPGLLYFREDLKFTEAEVEQATQQAIEFFNERFGLNFSGVEPDELGRRGFQNAIMSPYRIPINVTISAGNRWLINGRQGTSRCFDMQQGGYSVDMNGTQRLFGTWGREEGVEVPSGVSLTFFYYLIHNCPQSPTIIRVQSNTPAYVVPYDGLVVQNNDLFNRQLGQGLESGFNIIIPLAPDFTTARVIAHPVMTFPDSIELHPNP